MANLFTYVLVAESGQPYLGVTPALLPGQSLTGVYRETPDPSGVVTTLPVVGATATQNVYAEVIVGTTPADQSGSTPAGGGGSVAGVHVTHKFPFTHSTPNLLTGATAVFTDGYTPAIGDILHEAWFEIGTAWNGTLPYGDVGHFADGYGFWGNASSVGPPDMSCADGTGNLSPFLLGQVQQFNLAPRGAQTDLVRAATASPIRYLPAKFLTVDQIKVCVSQDGTTAGADPGSTQGAAILYVVTSTPA